MEGTAVIVQIAVGVVPIRCCGHWDRVAWRTRHDKRAFIDFLGVVAEQRDDAHDLRGNKERH